MAKRKLKLKKKIGAVLLVGLFGLLFYIGFKVFIHNDHWTLEWSRFNYESQPKYLVNNSEQPERGKIYDRNGKVLAEDVERYKVVAVVDKRQVKTVRNHDML